MKSLLTFYLKNFRVIHHFLFILMTFGFLKILSMIILILDNVFKTTPSGIFIQIIVLSLCLYFNEKALNQAGLTDDFMNNELEKIKKRNK